MADLAFVVVNGLACGGVAGGARRRNSERHCHGGQRRHSINHRSKIFRVLHGI
jgi:hypothetical protein